MLRIRYTFQSVENGIRWNDFLTNAQTVQEAFKEFKRVGPKYMIGNLVDMRMFSLVKDHYESKEVQIFDCDKEIQEFIVEKQTTIKMC